MIIKIDHIALEATQIPPVLSFLKRYGYKIAFQEMDLPVLKIKHRLMCTSSTFHQLHLLLHPLNYDIELLHHGGQKDSLSSEYVGFFFKETEWTEVVNLAGSQLIHTLILEEHPIFKYMGDISSSELNFNKIQLKVSNLELNVKFWKKCGFEEILINRYIAIMKFNDILKTKSLFLILARTEDAITDMLLDTPGFNCLAFITTNISNEKQSFQDEGYAATDVEELRVHNKNLKIFFVRSPEGAIIEIISL